MIWKEAYHVVQMESDVSLVLKVCVCTYIVIDVISEHSSAMDSEAGSITINCNLRPYNYNYIHICN